MKRELSLHDDGVVQWVLDVQQWAEDSNKRHHYLGHRRNEEKKKLAAAVEDYNRRADPSQKLGPVEDFFTDEAVVWPWEIPSST
ncbi:hypothetical protein M9458_056790, partial [Cirrhinus mrigala]